MPVSKTRIAAMALLLVVLLAGVAVVSGATGKQPPAGTTPSHYPAPSHAVPGMLP